MFFSFKANYNHPNLDGNGSVIPLSLPHQTFASLIGTCRIGSVSLCCEGFLPPSTDSIQICGFCLETHSVAHCPTLQAMKISQKGEAEAESLCAIAPRRPWQPRTSGMYQEYMQSFPQYHNQVPMQNIPNPLMPWQSWSTPQTQNQPFQQGWRGSASGNQYAPQHFYPSP